MEGKSSPGVTRSPGKDRMTLPVVFLEASPPSFFPFPNSLSRPKTHLSCHGHGRCRLDGRGRAFKQGQWSWASLAKAEDFFLFLPVPILSQEFIMRHVIVLRVPSCSPFGPSYVCWCAEAKFLFPFGHFLLSLSIPILPYCSSCFPLRYYMVKGWGAERA